VSGNLVINPKTKAADNLQHLISGLIGAVLLCGFSTLQRFLNDVTIPFSIELFVIPTLFGGAAGLIISVLYSKLKETTVNKQQNQQFLIDFMDNASDLIQSIGSNGELLFANQTWLDTMHYGLKDLQKLNVYDLIVEEDRERCKEQMKSVLEGNTIFLQFAMLSKTGEKIFLEGFTNCRFENGQPVATRSILRNITTNRHNEEALRLAAKVFEHASEGIYVASPDEKIITVNKAFTTITGYSEKGVDRQRLDILIDKKKTPKIVLDYLKAVIQSGKDWQGEVTARKKNGETFPAIIQINAVKNQNGAIENFIGFLTDISLRKETDDRLQFLATHDMLTSLPNRILFVDRLQNAIWQARRSSSMFAVLFLDLDGFKSINDELGHQIGDEFLRVIAKRLQGAIKETDIVARMGGDEFAVLLNNITNHEDAIKVSKRLLTTINKAVLIKQSKLQKTASIGISIYPEQNTVGGLLSSADQAMYIAKNNGKNCFSLSPAKTPGNLPVEIN